MREYSICHVCGGEIYWDFPCISCAYKRREEESKFKVELLMAKHRTRWNLEAKEREREQALEQERALERVRLIEQERFKQEREKAQAVSSIATTKVSQPSSSKLQKTKSGVNSSGQKWTYTGEYKNGMEHGYGKIQWSNGDWYEGGWKKGRRKGTGTYTWADGDSYTGDFKKNKRTGQGTFTWTNGDVYTGDFVKCERTGYGKLVFKNGVVQEGRFSNGKYLGP